MAWRSVLRNINLLNGILLSLALIFSFTFLFPQSEEKVSLRLPSPIKRPTEKAQSEPAKAQTPSPMDYVVIADENLFHPERRIPPEKKEEAALPKPEFVLYGTLITPEIKMAYLEDKKAPVSTPGRGKRQSALKVGESLSGFTLKEVSANRVVMSRGEETLSVLLDDPNSPKGREVAAAPPGAQAQAPGSPGAVPSPLTNGQPVPRPVPVKPGTGLIPGGAAPANPAPGVGTPMQPAFPGAIAPSTPSPAFPSRRQRFMQSLQ